MVAYSDDFRLILIWNNHWLDESNVRHVEGNRSSCDIVDAEREVAVSYINLIEVQLDSRLAYLVFNVKETLFLWILPNFLASHNLKRDFKFVVSVEI